MQGANAYSKWQPDWVENKAALTSNTEVPVMDMIVQHPDPISNGTDHCQRDYNNEQPENLHKHKMTGRHDMSSAHWAVVCQQ